MGNKNSGNSGNHQSARPVVYDYEKTILREELNKAQREIEYERNIRKSREEEKRRIDIANRAKEEEERKRICKEKQNA